MAPAYVDETFASALVAALWRFTSNHASGQGPVIWQDPNRERTSERCARSALM